MSNIDNNHLIVKNKYELSFLILFKIVIPTHSLGLNN